jgi:hypothetical protein
MKRKFAPRLFTVPILFLLLTQTGCYAPAYYPSYDPGYVGMVPYQGGYPVPAYGPTDPDGYGQPDQQGYGGQDDGGQAYRDDDNDDDEWESSGEQYPSWQDNPEGSYSEL